MFECKICKRRFKTEKALGGHISGAHPKQKAEAQSGAAVARQANNLEAVGSNPTSATSEGVEPEAGAPAGEGNGEAAQIRGYLDQGYTFEQLTRQFGFKESTVRQEIAKHLPPQTKAEEDSRLLPVTVKATEAITPESIMQRFLADGGRDWQLRLEGMMLLRAAQKMNKEDVSTLAELVETMAKATESQLKVLREAKSESAEVANRAAASVGAQLMPEIEALKTHMVAQAPNPMASLMMTLMEPAFRQAAQQIAGMFVRTQPTPQAEQPGQPGPPPAQPWTPPNVEIHRREELQE